MSIDYHFFKGIGYLDVSYVSVMSPRTHTVVSRPTDDQTDSYIFLTDTPRLHTPDLYEFTICMWLKVITTTATLGNIPQAWYRKKITKAEESLDG